MEIFKLFVYKVVLFKEIGWVFLDDGDIFCVDFWV